MFSQFCNVPKGGGAGPVRRGGAISHGNNPNGQINENYHTKVAI